MADIPQSFADNLQTALNAQVTLLSNLENLLNTEIAFEVANGPKPTYTLSSPEGSRTVDWNTWRAGIMSQMTELLDSIEKKALLISKFQSFDIVERKRECGRYW